MTSPVVVSPDGVSITYNGQQYFLPGNTWSVNPDGSTTFNGSIWFPAGFNNASGAGIVVFGPGGGKATFPAVQPGPPGPATKWAISMVPVAYGTPLPSPNPEVVATEWDSEGNPVALSLTFYNWAGPAGQDGQSVIPATLDGVAAKAGYMIGWDAENNTAQWQPAPVGAWQYATGIVASASNTNSQKQIGSIQVQAQAQAWWPEVQAQGNVIGAVDTRVDLVARVGGTAGEICAYGFGNPGVSPGTVYAIASGLGPGSANIVPAGQAATIYLYAENKTSSANDWSTTASCSFQVRPSFVPL